jgi:sigma-B regulation protein RsbU (phosphoserine phosphatase)
MTLRARITLIVTLSFVVLVVGITYGALLREQVLADRFAASRVRAQQSLWLQVTGREAQDLSRRLDAFEDIPGLGSLVAEGDRAALPRLIQPIAGRLRQEAIPLVEVVDLRGQLLYSSSGQASVEGRAVTEAGELTRAVEARVTQTAVLRGHDGEVLVAVVHPLLLQGEAVGCVVLGRPVSSVLEAIKAETGIDVFLADPRGGLLEGTAPDLWDSIAPPLAAAGMTGVFDLSAGGRVFGVVARTLSSAGGNRLAVHVTAEDITETHGRLDLARKVSIGGSVLFGMVLLLGLSVYMARSFQPLQAAIDGLNALSQGDMSVEVDSGGHDQDEVGRVAHAVRVFRDKLRREHRTADSRDRRRRRQQRFIRRQMLSLADTLDEEARLQVLEDLERIEQAETQAAGRDGAAGMDTLPLAFDVMVRRVRDQHGRLDTLVGRLREALEAKTELAGLQQQMEAAGRMQEAMLPPPLPPRDDLEVAGRLTRADAFGGTFFDYMPLSGDRLGVVFGQIEGQGLPAAFATHTVRALIRLALVDGAAPEQALDRVGAVLGAEAAADGLTVHAFVGAVDGRSGKLSYAVAGGLPTLMLRRIGDVTRLPPPADGPPLGAGAGSGAGSGAGAGPGDGRTYAGRTVDLPPRGVVVLCSTGVAAAVAGGAAGDAGLQATLRGADDLTPGVLAGTLAEAAETAGPRPPRQDLTCLVLRVGGTRG